MGRASRLSVLGAGLRSCLANSGVERAPARWRESGLLALLVGPGIASAHDSGDVPISNGTGDATSPTGRVLNQTSVRGAMLAIAQRVAGERFDGNVPVVLGGDCSVLPAVIAGLHDGSQPTGRIGLVSFDGYGEFHTAETTLTGDISGMALAICCGRGDLLLTRLARERFPLVQEVDVVRVGARSFDPGEEERLQTSRVTQIRPPELRGPGGGAPFRSALGRLTARTRHMVLHLSVSVLDAAGLPIAVGPAAPGGLSLNAVAAALAEVGSMSAADVLELDALVVTGVDGTAAQSAARLVNLSRVLPSVWAGGPA